jgi:uncharacterized SAM-binding protein YcdF (DUF218 family)
MRAVVTDLVHLLFTLSFYGVVLLMVVTFFAWRRGAASALRPWRFALAGVTLGAILVTVPAVPNYFVNHIEGIHTRPSDVALAELARRGDTQIVVLTGGWFRSTDQGYEVMMGGNSWERTWSAVSLWKRIGGTLIFAGAPLPDESDSVAQHMAVVAREMGVPADRIQVEARSRNTHENLVFTQRQAALGGTHAVILLTSALHLPRSVAIARRLGLSVMPYPCDYRGERRTSWQAWLPNNDAPGALEEALHEWVGLVWYRLRGWA